MKWIVFIIATISASGAVVDSGRIVDWSYCGVRGGIPEVTTISTTLSSSATYTDINNALSAASSNQVVLLNAGTYTLAGAINFASLNGRVLRGTTNSSGVPTTILSFTHGGNDCFHSSQGDMGNSSALSSGYTKGSTSIVFTATPHANFAAGKIMQLSQNDDTNFVFSSSGPSTKMRFTCEILSVSGTTVTFTPPLPWTLTASLSPVAIVTSSGGIIRSGVEDIIVHNTGLSSYGFEWWQSMYCWWKNVTISNIASEGILMRGGHGNTVTHCYFRDVEAFGSNPDGDGILIDEYANSGPNISGGWHRIENNIFKNLWYGVMIEASSTIAVVYNFATNSAAADTGAQVGSYNCNHAAHNMMSLWEGNIGEQFQNDAYFGSSSHQTLHRNWIHGMSSFTGNRKMVDIGRGGYYWNLLGNILGHSSWNPTALKMTTEDDFSGMYIYRLGYPNPGNNDTNAPAGNPWPAPYREAGIGNGCYPDPVVESTLWRHGNYDTHNDAQVWEAGEADHSLVDSYIHTSKPSYFGFLAWPPFNPANGTSQNVTNIPAGYRFVFGTNPPSASSDISGVASSSRKIRGIRIRQ